MATATISVVLLVLFSPFLVLGDTCVGAKPSVDTYTTSNILFSTETAFIIELGLTCDNKPEQVNLYAEVNGKVMPVSKSSDNKKYQVSWTGEHKVLKAGHYKVNFYDDDGYSAFRKAQRSGSQVEIKPLFVVDVNHKGAGRDGLWVQTEFLAVIIALLIWWCANNMKSKLQE